jgi:glutamate dehydrogenase
MERMMSPQPRGRTAELIDKLVLHAQNKLPKGQTKQVEAFLRQYYVWVSPDDLIKQDILDLSGAALAHWQLARQRSPSEAKVRVYNPRAPKPRMGQ